MQVLVFKMLDRVRVSSHFVRCRLRGLVVSIEILKTAAISHLFLLHQPSTSDESDKLSVMWMCAGEQISNWYIWWLLLQHETHTSIPEFLNELLICDLSPIPPGPWMPRGAPSSVAQCFPMAGSWPRHQEWRCASSWERRSRRPSTATGCCVPPTQSPSSSSPPPASSPAGRRFCLEFVAYVSALNI